MPGEGARGVSTAAVRGSAGAGGISGCPAFGTAGCAPVTCAAGGFAGDAAAGSGVFVPAAEDGSAAFGAGVDLQDKTASQRNAALVRMDDQRSGSRYVAPIDSRCTCVSYVPGKALAPSAWRVSKKANW